MTTITLFLLLVGLFLSTFIAELAITAAKGLLQSTPSTLQAESSNASSTGFWSQVLNPLPTDYQRRIVLREKIAELDEKRPIPTIVADYRSDTKAVANTPKSLLYSHITNQAAYHDSNYRSDYNCITCGKDYASQNALNGHMKAHRGMK